MFSGFNNACVYSLLDDKYSDKFGFTESEVEDVLSRCGVLEKLDEVR